MPYIKQSKREPILNDLEPLIRHIVSLPMEEQDGAINFAISTLLKEVYSPSYFNYNRSMGVLACVQEEWYRRSIAPYEEKKIQENGDI